MLLLYPLLPRFASLVGLMYSYAHGSLLSWFLGDLSGGLTREKPTAEDSDTGETAYVVRWNTTAGQDLARFVRKPLSFSKSMIMHEACLLLLLHCYNLERTIILM